jgi:Tfp pilus assembly protein PilN
MINLLPEANRKELKKEETFHLILIFGVLSVVFCICLSLLLLSIRIYVSGEIQTQKILVESQKEEEKESPLGEIRSINRDITGLNDFYQEQVVFSDMIMRISDAAPKGVHLISFNYTPPFSQIQKEEEPLYARVSLTGFAPTTEDLLAFRANLEGDALFESFNFPSSNWNEESNISFSFDFAVNPYSL